MEFATLYKELEALGTEKTKKTYIKHGNGSDKNVFGISFADLNRYKKTIKQDHPLALKLYDTQVLECMILAAMIADPDQLSLQDCRNMISKVKFYMVSNYLGGLFARTPFALELMEEEMQSSNEYTKHNGYDILSTVLKIDADRLSLSKCKTYLKNIEKEIHHAPNRAKNAMNTALISIGVYKTELSQTAIETGERIGKVDVDHGNTSCKTHYAPNYIKKCLEKAKA